MKKVLSTLLLGAISLGASALRAESIDWSALGTAVPLHLSPTSGGGAVPLGSLAYVGQFPAGFVFATNQTLPSLLAAFTILDQVFVGVDESAVGAPSVGAGAFYGQISGNPIQGTNGSTGLPAAATVGQPLYIWVFNASTTGAATQWGIVTQTPSDNWTFSAGAVATNAIDISDPNVFVPAGALGAMINNELFLGNAVVVPEPSTYILGLAGLGVMAAIRRRRVSK